LQSKSLQLHSPLVKYTVATWGPNSSPKSKQLLSVWSIYWSTQFFLCLSYRSDYWLKLSRLPRYTANSNPIPAVLPWLSSPFPLNYLNKIMSPLPR